MDVSEESSTTSASLLLTLLTTLSFSYFQYCRKAKKIKNHDDPTEPNTYSPHDPETPSLVHRNRHPGHVILAGYQDLGQALTNVEDVTESDQITLLNDGPWLFHFHELTSSAIDQRLEFIQPHFVKDSSWNIIEVPGCWQLQGDYDPPIYTNIKYPFPRTPPFVPSPNLIGDYRCEFEFCEQNLLQSKRRRTFLRFDGVDSAFHVWWNGHFLGYSTDSRLPAEFDITDVLLKNRSTEKHVLAVRVYRWSCSSYLEDQDMWWLSGIQHNVSIVSLPDPMVIFDYAWTTNIDSLLAQSSSSGLLSIEMTLHSYMDHTENHDMYDDYECHVDLFDHAQELVLTSKQRLGSKFQFFSDPPCSSSGVKNIRINDVPIQNLRIDFKNLEIPSPRLWTAETPYLYTLVVSLHDTRSANVVQAESCYVGLRKIEVRHGNVLLNNKAVYFYGVNHHEHSAKSGKHVSRDFLEQEVRLMKQFNINAVRMSHYPQHPHLYDLCSRYGLYVIDEANVETHGFAPNENTLANLPEWQPQYLARLKRMVARDRNHACIVAWSLGNESGVGQAHEVMATWIRQHDPSRFLHYEPASVLEPEVARHATDVLCPMYDRIPDMLKRIQRIPDMPLILCEYSHAMGNSNGNLDQYWHVFREHAQLQGGFIWDWQDQALELDIPRGLGEEENGRPSWYWGYGGDTGDQNTPHDGCFNCNGLVLPDLTPHPALYECKYLFQPFVFHRTGGRMGIIPFLQPSDASWCFTFECQNEQFFQDTSPFEFHFELLASGHVVTSGSCPPTHPIAPRTGATMSFSICMEDIHIIGSSSSTKPALWNLYIYASLTQPNAIGAPKNHVAAWQDLLLTSEEQEQLMSYSNENMTLNRSMTWNLKNPFRSSQSSLRSLSTIERGAHAISVQGVNFELEFDVTRGGLVSYRVGEHELLSSPCVFQFHRACTDNDRGGCHGSYLLLWERFGLDGPTQAPENHTISWSADDDDPLGNVQIKCTFDLRPNMSEQESKRMTSGPSTSTTNPDVNTSLVNAEVQDPSDMDASTRTLIDILLDFVFQEHQPQELELAPMGKFRRLLAHQYAEALHLGHETIVTKSNEKTVRLWKKGSSSSFLSDDDSSSSSRPFVFQCQIIYTVSPVGKIEMDCHVRPYHLWPCLPRIGLQFALNDKYQSTTWFGNGPWECYRDRQSSTRLAIHHKDSVVDMFFPYIRPSENGNRTNIQWMKMSDSTDGGPLPPLFFEMKDSQDKTCAFNFSALPYSTAELDKANHVYELPSSESKSNGSASWINIDYCQMGVGGDDSWTPAVHSEHLIHPNQMFTFKLVFYPLADDDQVITAT